MYQLNFVIETLSPIVISALSNPTVMTKTHSEISGSIIRGVLASKYVEEKNLGKAAHKDLTFQKLFYGDLKFLPATPEIAERRSFVLPLSLQKGKAGTAVAEKIQDLLTAEKIEKGYKNFRGYGVLDGENIQTASVETNISMHMSRSSEDERLAGKSAAGNIYNYESLDEGQKFFGTILGSKAELQKLSDELNLENNFFNAYIGRSKFTQYGKCKITFGQITQTESQTFAENIYLRLETPLISAEDYFIGAEKILSLEVVEVLNKICGEEIFSLGKVFASSVEIENFAVAWGMKRPRVLALAAGTVFELKTEKNLSAEILKTLEEKIFSGFGIRTEEGFGQLRLWETKNFKLGKVDKIKIEKPKTFSEKTIEIVKKILLSRFLEQVRIYAHEDAEKLKSKIQSGNMTHFFSRLDAILNAAATFENFQNLLEAELRDGTLFETHLKNLRMANGQTFFDVLTGKADFPRKIDEIKIALTANKFDGEKNISDLLNELEINFKFAENKFYLEYLQNYFKFAEFFLRQKKELTKKKNQL